jgi:hypothetical protein
MPNRIEDFEDRVNDLHKEIKYEGTQCRYLVVITKLEDIVLESKPVWETLFIENSKHQYGYVPTHPERVTRETELFKQIVTDLNLESVVRSVNGL